MSTLLKLEGVNAGPREARDRLEQAGLGERCEIRLQDYRDCTGSFSRIVSIEKCPVTVSRSPAAINCW